MMLKENKSHKLHILITPSQYEKVRNYADQKDTTIADVLRRYIDRLPKETKKN